MRTDRLDGPPGACGDPGNGHARQVEPQHFAFTPGQQLRPIAAVRRTAAGPAPDQRASDFRYGSQPQICHPDRLHDLVDAVPGGHDIAAAVLDQLQHAGTVGDVGDRDHALPAQFGEPRAKACVAGRVAVLGVPKRVTQCHDITRALQQRLHQARFVAHQASQFDAGAGREPPAQQAPHDGLRVRDDHPDFFHGHLRLQRCHSCIQDEPCAWLSKSAKPEKSGDISEERNSARAAARQRLPASAPPGVLFSGGRGNAMRPGGPARKGGITPGSGAAQQAVCPGVLVELVVVGQAELLHGNALLRADGLAAAVGLARNLDNRDTGCTLPYHFQFAARQDRPVRRLIQAARSEDRTHRCRLVAQPAERGTHRRHQFLDRIGLVQDHGNADILDIANQRRIIQHGHHHDPGGGITAAQHLQHRQAVAKLAARHGVVGHDNVAIRVFKQLHQLGGICGTSDDLHAHFVRQDPAHPVKDDGVVICDDYLDHSIPLVFVVSAAAYRCAAEPCQHSMPVIFADLNIRSLPKNPN
ncbi:hypothetical protein CNECB9_2420012 [Cupriavidus necator]|uniref:Uncharacterized protein n=1 Tax=Cupriavidus necator TaxID=106590 RepID=A0A1K0J994_CUPNE|nr:hypothetical protein CNECB9_2420012 [Cupriavidus necator]